MATTARLDLSVWRNDDVYEFPLRVIGPDLTAVNLRAQVRLAPDTPGPALVALEKVGDAGVQGVRLAGVTPGDRGYVNDIRIFIDKATRQNPDKMPYDGELGDASPLAWAMQIGGRTRIVGKLFVLAHTMDSDAAPMDRSGEASARAALPSGGASLTIAADDVAELVIDGADLIGAAAVEAAASANDASKSAGLVREARPTLGEAIDVAAIAISPAGSATIIPRGLRLTPDSSGSFIDFDTSPLLPDGVTIPVGSTVRVRALFAVTAGFGGPDMPINFGGWATKVVYGDGTPTSTTAGAVDADRSVIVGTMMSRETTVTWAPAMTRLGQLVQINSNGPWTFSGTRDIVLKSLAILVDSVPAGTAYSAADLTAQIAAAREEAAFVRSKATSVGDVATYPSAVVAAIPAMTQQSRTRVFLDAWPYSTERNIVPLGFVDLTGAGRSRASLSFARPDNVDPAQIPATEIIRADRTALFEGLALDGANIRYPLHTDSSGRVTDYHITVRNARIVHRGNQGARNYRISQGGDGGDVWISAVAYGIGTSSGGLIEIEGSTLLGYHGGLLAHDFASFTKPSVIRCVASTIRTTGPVGDGYGLQSLGAMVESRFEAQGCDFGLSASAGTGEWMQADPALNPADHQQWRITTIGCRSYAFKVTDAGRALRIDSAGQAGSFVLVSGSAVSVLFGPAGATGVTGAPGLRGYAYGYYDVDTLMTILDPATFTQLTNRNSLGARLGDCRGAAKTLTITTEAGNATVTFNADHRAQSNATILGMINAALGALGKASTFSPGERMRPSRTDEEARLTNAGDVTILMGAMCAWSDSRDAVRAMLDTDPDELFAGIALEDIVPGARGRAQVRGYLYMADVPYEFGAGVDDKPVRMGDRFRPRAMTVDGIQIRGTLLRRPSPIQRKRAYVQYEHHTAGGREYVVTTAGTTAAAAPAWGNADVTDGTVTWSYVGPEPDQRGVLPVVAPVTNGIAGQQRGAILEIAA